MPSTLKPVQPVMPLVVKLGGSLNSHVPELAGAFIRAPRPILIVPGGGHYADAVRALQLSDEEAHWNAIEAMDTYGRYIATFGIETTDRLQTPKNTVVLLPLRCTRHFDPLPHSWDITSDTIAAWVADRLRLELLVLKSVDGIQIDGSLAGTILESFETDVVDPCFITYVLQHHIRTTIINGTVLDLVAGFLRGEQVPCTRIGTTF